MEKIGLTRKLIRKMQGNAGTCIVALNLAIDVPFVR
jgi:hypothetical protein